MNIDPAKASIPKAPILEEANRFGRGYFDHARECEPKRKKFLAIRDHPTDKLTQHCRMHDNLGAFQQSNEIGIGTMEMIDPNRGVDKDAHSIIWNFAVSGLLLPSVRSRRVQLNGVRLRVG
jgi:hypothetical protein